MPKTGNEVPCPRWANLSRRNCASNSPPGQSCRSPWHALLGSCASFEPAPVLFHLVSNNNTWATYYIGSCVSFAPAQVLTEYMYGRYISMYTHTHTHIHTCTLNIHLLSCAPARAILRLVQNVWVWVWVWVCVCVRARKCVLSFAPARALLRLRTTQRHVRGWENTKRKFES